MAENLGQIDVVIQSDNQTLVGPGTSPIGPGVRPSVGAATGAAAGAGAAGFAKSHPVLLGLAAAAAVATAGFYAAAKVIKSWNNEANALRDRFARLNSGAALAGAIRQVGQFKRDMEMSKTLGPLLLNLEKMRERVADGSNKLRTFIAAIKVRVLTYLFALFAKLQEKVLPKLLEALETAAITIAKTMETFVTFVSDMLISFGNIMTVMLPSMLGGAAGESITSVGLGIRDMLEFLKKIGRDVNDIKNQGEIDPTSTANALVMQHLQTMTGGLWKYSTQQPGALASGRELNPQEFNRLSDQDKKNWGK